MSLRARLFLALLAVALVPTAVFTAFTLDQLDRSTRRWFRPGVDRALESAHEVSRTALARLDATVLAAADQWSRDWRGPLDPAHRADLGASLSAAGLDLTQLYERREGRWRLADQILAEKLIVAEGPDFSDQIGGALESTRTLHGVRGALAAVAPAGPDRAVVVGISVPPDFFDQVERTGEGLAHYRALGVLVDIQRRFAWLLVLAVVAALLALALVAATLLARSAARPLSALSAAIERVAQGELSTRVNPSGARELRTLGAAFNAMTGHLAVARDRLREAEREAAWRRAASQIAHEIKNSLTPMRLSLARVERRLEAIPLEQRPAVQHSVGVLLQEIEDLARLADHFSEYARLPEPRLETLDLAEVASAAAGLHEAGVVESRTAPGCRLPVRGDRLLLSRALHNLILNAREASPPGAVVEVRAERTEDRGVVEVLDRGAGVPDTLRERVFEPYVSSKARGSGLGLALVRDIATQHAGTVTLEDRTGGGTCARLSLPLVDDRRGGTAQG